MRCFLLFFAVLFSGCTIPCEPVFPEAFCDPPDIDADVIGDTGVTVLEIPHELQNCVRGFVPLGTQICEHTGGEPTLVCSYPPPGSVEKPVCNVVNDPLVFQVKTCLQEDRAPVATHTCKTCEQSLEGVDALDELQAALAFAPVCTSAKAYNPNADLCPAAKPLLNLNFCKQNIPPQKCVAPHVWAPTLTCKLGLPSVWIHTCVCK